MDDLQARQDEIEALCCIFPETEVHPLANGEICCTIDVPIELEWWVLVESGERSVIINHLPSLKLSMLLKSDYPSSSAPEVTIDNNTHEWLPEEKIISIKKDLADIWESYRSSVLYAYIDSISTSGRVGFSIFQNTNESVVIGGNSYEITHKLTLKPEDTIFDYLMKANEEAQQKLFDQQTFPCDICQSEQKGSESTQFPQCEHVFCNLCLNDYFTHIIERGEIEAVHCPSFDCTKEHRQYIDHLYKLAEEGRISDFQKFDTAFFRLPIETVTLKRFLPEETYMKLIERYRELHFRASMDAYRRFFPNRVAECPRSLCSTTFIKGDPDSKLAICPTCKFAFCSDCFHSWHGNINSCSMYMRNIPSEAIEAWIEHNGTNPNLQSLEDRDVCSNIAFKYGRKIVELAVSEHIAQEQFEELIKSGEAEIIKCPNCNTYIQRSDGCNKMTCMKCLVFFCNICGDRLGRDDPYEHYNNPMNKCFGKLFEGMVSEET